MVSPKKHLLIIEDEPGVAELLKKVCLTVEEALKYDVIVTPRLATGLEWIQKGNVDVVLLDLNLPDSKGAETFEKVQSQCAGAPIVVITGLGEKEVYEKVKEKDAAAFLKKGNLDITEITATLNQILSNSR